jgi:protein-tyrosine phosphatase
MRSRAFRLPEIPRQIWLGMTRVMNMSNESRSPFGRIDVHSHLLPGVDDGCKTVEESLRCARELVAAGYTHVFCTPHVWPNLRNTIKTIPQWTDALQAAIDRERIPLRLIPGGEINLHRQFYTETPAEEVVTYGMARKFVLMDFWVDRLPDYVRPSVQWFQSLGLTVILAHPERMRAIQDDPTLAEFFASMGVLLQGNLACFNDPPHALTRRTAERFLEKRRYFMLGTDLHGYESLAPRLAGLRRVEELVGVDEVRRLTSENPATLIRGGKATDQQNG